MDFKVKYFKYKKKYIFLKNQLGGNLIDKQTIRNKEFDLNNKQTIDQLVDLDIDCNIIDGINKIKLDREQYFNTNSQENNKILYNYKCLEDYNYNRNSIQKNTSLDDIGNGIRYLDRHNIDCNSTAIKDIQLKKLNNKIRYDYKCGQVNLNDITNHETNFDNDGSGKNIYLDRHDIKCPNDKVLTQIKLSTRYPNGYNNPADIQYQYKCGNLPKDLVYYVKKYNITGSDSDINSDYSKVQFLINASINPKFHAILWKLFYVIIEKTKKYNNNFILSDSGNVLAYKEYGYPQYPWDDDIDVGFLTNNLYTEFFEFMEKCLDLGFNLWVYARVKAEMPDESKNESWYDKNNLKTIELTYELLKSLTPENFWFIKITFNRPKFLLLKTKIGLKDKYFFNGIVGNEENEVIPWLDIQPFVKVSENNYNYKFGNFTNMKTASIITNTFVNLYNMNLIIPDNITIILNKYKGENEYTKKSVLYNHINQQKYGTMLFTSDNIRNFVKDYITEHHKKLNDTIKLIMDNDIV